MPQITSRFGNSKPQTGICELCGGKATLLCDMPKETEVASIKSKFTNTCDREICEKCSIKFHGNDFCLACIREIRDIWNVKIMDLMQD